MLICLLFDSGVVLPTWFFIGCLSVGWGIPISACLLLLFLLLLLLLGWLCCLFVAICLYLFRFVILLGGWVGSLYGDIGLGILFDIIVANSYWFLYITVLNISDVATGVD